MAKSQHGNFNNSSYNTMVHIFSVASTLNFLNTLSEIAKTAFHDTILSSEYKSCSMLMISRLPYNQLLINTLYNVALNSSKMIVVNGHHFGIHQKSTNHCLQEILTCTIFTSARLHMPKQERYTTKLYHWNDLHYQSFCDESKYANKLLTQSISNLQLCFLKRFTQSHTLIRETLMV